MDIYLDTVSLDKIKKYIYFIDGITTNPSLVSREGSDMFATLESISSVFDKPVHIEVMSTEADDMFIEGMSYFSVSQNVIIKLPATMDGFVACKKLSDSGVPTNITLCFSCGQAILAAKCNATYVSPFVGRLDDSGINGIERISNIVEIYKKQEFQTSILAASIRSIDHVVECAKVGVDAITLPPKILEEMMKHDLTSKGLECFQRDYLQKRG